MTILNLFNHVSKTNYIKLCNVSIKMIHKNSINYYRVEVGEYLDGVRGEPNYFKKLMNPIIFKYYNNKMRVIK
jgi:hypothetical protein